MRKTIAALFILFLVGACAAQVSDLGTAEVVVFYPSYLTWNTETESWSGFILGKVHEPSDGVSRKLKLAAVRKLLDIDGDLTGDQERLFQSRAGEFTVDNKRKRKIAVRIGDRKFISSPSLANGHFAIEVTWSGGQAGVTLPFTAGLSAADPREFGGQLHLLGPAGISVISDIDDTVKESNVLDHDELLANTFLRKYRVVDGMPQLYKQWGDQGATVHFVTGSPWQLYHPLWVFLREHRFPGVEIQMRHLRLKDSSIVKFFRDPRAYKSRRIRDILRRFPERRFILVGDSGERDPRIYATLARKYPDRVVGIFIRAVRSDHRDRSRFRELFRGIDPSRWIIFHKADELPPNLAAWSGPVER